jgi:predicted ArsR family transcriptional regulator
MQLSSKDGRPASVESIEIRRAIADAFANGKDHGFSAPEIAETINIDKYDVLLALRYFYGSGQLVKVGRRRAVGGAGRPADVYYLRVIV